MKREARKGREGASRPLARVPQSAATRMSDGKDSLEKQLNGFGEQGRERSRTALVISQAVNRSIFTSAVSPAAERIRFILGEEDDSPAPPQLFTELDELLAIDGQEMEWKETARWVGLAFTGVLLGECTEEPVWCK